MRDRNWRSWINTARAPGRRPVRAGAGFTLIELMVTVAVLAVLVAVAAPSLTTLIQDNRIRSQANDLMTNLAIARSESAKQGRRVTVCTSTSYAAANPDCTAGGATAWNAGYILFIDQNQNGAFDGAFGGITDTLLRIGEPLTGGNTLVSSGFNAPAAAGSFQFRPSGNTNLPAAGGSFKLCDSRVGNFGRLITIQVTGRTISTTTNCP